jgi:hypothetical protein
MAYMLNYNISEKLPQIRKAGMAVLEECCEIIVNQMKADLGGVIEANWKRHGVYKTGKDAGKIWTARDSYIELLKTIRLVKKNEGDNIFGLKNNNIWVMAGNYKTWWAKQAEYGRGDWKGGKRPFFRSGINKSLPQIEALLASRKIT